MSGAVVVVIARDFFREDLDSSWRSWQRIGLGIHPEIFEEDVRGRGLGNLEVAAAPELVEGGPLRHVTIRTLARCFVNVSEPLHDGPAFGERFASAEAVSEIAQDCKVVARLADRRDGLFHRDDE